MANKSSIVCLRCDEVCGPEDIFCVEAKDALGKRIQSKCVRVCNTCIAEERLCLNCGKKLKEIVDPIQGVQTGHIYQCDCIPEGVIISISL